MVAKWNVTRKYWTEGEGAKMFASGVTPEEAARKSGAKLATVQRAYYRWKDRQDGRPTTASSASRIRVLPDRPATSADTLPPPEMLVIAAVEALRRLGPAVMMQFALDTHQRAIDRVIAEKDRELASALREKVLLERAADDGRLQRAGAIHSND